ncbi:MAG: helix-turn-helix transcriptional regulator, partial [Pseudomonadota bacterium]
LKMDGRPSQLLNGVHYYNFHDDQINFLGPSEQSEERRFKAYESPHRGRDSGRIPSFLRSKGPINIGGRIRDFRLEKNISQVELARILKVTPSALSQIENNQSVPSLSLFIEIARFFERSLDSFFTDSPASSKTQRHNRRERAK